MGRLRSKPVEDFMNRDPVFVSKDEQIGVALEIMERSSLRTCVTRPDPQAFSSVRRGDCPGTLVLP